MTWSTFTPAWCLHADKIGNKAKKWAAEDYGSRVQARVDGQQDACRHCLVAGLLYIDLGERAKHFTKWHEHGEATTTRREKLRQVMDEHNYYYGVEVGKVARQIIDPEEPWWPFATNLRREQWVREACRRHMRLGHLIWIENRPRFGWTVVTVRTAWYK